VTRNRDDWLLDVDDLSAETERQRNDLDALLLSDPTPLPDKEPTT
jgi:hypothetical protein